MTDLSVLIPARNEQFLARTIQDLLANIRGNTEIIAVLDGEWADPPIDDHERVTLVYLPESVGQRAATNIAARISQSKYVMKCDAHCAFDEGFDVKLMSVMQDNWTLVPQMRNLHVFDLVCMNGHHRYQGPSGKCPECGEPLTMDKMDVVWRAKPSPKSMSYCFDTEPHFRYFGEYNKRPEGKGNLTESMSIQGSCFMLTRDKYFDLDICEEAFGTWGSQGIEVSCKTWLSGGRVMVYHDTWYAHAFRTQGGEWGFPYHLSGRQVEHAKRYARELFFENKWPKQIYPLSWLIEKFKPLPGWHEESGKAILEKITAAGAAFRVVNPSLHKMSGVVTNMGNSEIIGGSHRTPPSQVSGLESERSSHRSDSIISRGIVYYTDNRLDQNIMQACQKQIIKSVNGNEIISVSLQPIDFGENIRIDKERGYLTMFEQILAGLEKSDADIVFFCEHDVLYSPSHFDFIPPKPETFYYNQNVWKVDYETGRALFYLCKQTLGLCAYRELLLEHYRTRCARTEIAMKSMGGHEFNSFIRRQGFEPGSHHRTERVDDHPSDVWMSEVPLIDIRHGQNLTPSRWRQDQFRDQRNCQGWKEAEEIPGWGNAKELLEKIDGKSRT